MFPNRHHSCSSAEIVTDTDHLPKAASRGDHIVTRGYATHLEHADGHQWLFFPALEPAYVAGRAVRMATGAVAWNVYQAAFQLRWDDHEQRDVSTLFVNESRSYRDHDNESPILTRWAKRVSASSSHWPS